MEDRFAAQHAEWGRDFGDAIVGYMKERQLFSEGERLDAAAVHLYRTWFMLPLDDAWYETIRSGIPERDA